MIGGTMYAAEENTAFQIQIDVLDNEMILKCKLQISDFQKLRKTQKTFTSDEMYRTHKKNASDK